MKRKICRKPRLDKSAYDRELVRRLQMWAKSISEDEGVPSIKVCIAALQLGWLYPQTYSTNKLILFNRDVLSVSTTLLLLLRL